MSDGLRVLMIGDDAGFADAVRNIVTAQLPEAACDRLAPAQVKLRPDAAAIIIDARNDHTAGTLLAQRVRGMGFAGATVLAATPASSDAEQGTDAAPRFGWHAVTADRLAHDLMPALAAAMDGAQSPYAPQVMRARRLVAAGELALTLQHALNNPLAGVLAEAQMMQLDPDAPAEQTEAATRIIALCRRMIDLIHALDGMGERKQGTS